MPGLQREVDHGLVVSAPLEKHGNSTILMQVFC